LSKVAKEIPALRVNQWLDYWDKVQFNPAVHRRKPDRYFYIFSMNASDLKALTGIQRRTVEGGLLRSQDLGIQRLHEPDRSEKIGMYIQYGYPWSDLSARQRSSGEFETLRKPGWLPTAVVVNVLKRDDKRHDIGVDQNDLVTFVVRGNGVVVRLPSNFTGKDWKPKKIYPVEVIDGQHRLWAFERKQLKGNFELPVVAFSGLDISWQAYQFWTINISPKPINASLAYDLYPLLRTEDWLERAERAFVYRETRAQELVEALWSHPQSPWYHHINMLGEPKHEPMVTQAAWIRSLIATYVKSWESRRIPIGGLFGAKIGQQEEVLAWKRSQQAAFLIFVGKKILEAVESCTKPWAVILRRETSSKLDAAFGGPYSLLNTDQGIRGILHVTNDLCYVKADQLKLREFREVSDKQDSSDESAVTRALLSIERQKSLVPLNNFMESVAKSVAKYDWRASSEPSLTVDERTSKLVFRGSSGYKELRRQLLEQMAKDKGVVGNAAEKVLEDLGYRR
jgi:hypothetical protein